MRQLKIATGKSRRSLTWNNRELTWEAFVGKLRNPKVTDETYDEYMSMSKDRQADIKDVGGFVAGYLRGGRRQKNTLAYRSMITLDADYAHDYSAWSRLLDLYGCVCCMYTTHKHCPAKPRYRIVIPLTRDVDADEYQAVARRLAADIGIEDFDDTTYEAARLMYWPSVSKGGEYRFTTAADEGVEGTALDPDLVLASYDDWHDTSCWPVSSRQEGVVHAEVRTVGDPADKPNPIGVFCREWDVASAIARFIPDVYTEAGPGRYTYAGGTSASGLVTMGDGRLAYSHHGSDPAAGAARNAFDLVRIHLFGHLDEDIVEGTALTSLPSFRAMRDLAYEQPEIRKRLAEERMTEAREDFSPVQTEEDTRPAEPDKEDKDWKEKLDIDKKGNIKSTADNIALILRCDTNLKGAVGYDELRSRRTVLRRLPWRKSCDRDTCWRDVDDSGLRVYFESVYGISSRDKIADAVALVSQECSYHPVRDYLDSLSWDGQKRLDTLLVDYLAAEDTPYTRAVTRKALVAAVARVRRPGIKFDNVLTLVGGQGIGKSMLVQRLSRGWYTDSVTTVQGKEAYEQIQGFWLVELGELASLKKAELESIKSFISKNEDSFRAAYAHNAEIRPRQCVFIGTTNASEFLRDPTGNRRFWPVEVSHRGRYTVMRDLTPAVVDQLWAEADAVWKSGTEDLYLTGEEAEAAVREQASHTETDERTGIVSDYLDTPVPEDFAEWTRERRSDYFWSPDMSLTGTVRRDEVSVAEVYVECLHGILERRTHQDSVEIGIMLRQLGWVPVGNRRVKAYGVQKMYRRPARFE